MKVHTLVRSMAILLFGALASWSAQALNVTITVSDPPNTPPFIIPIPEGASAVNLDASLPRAGSAASYGNFWIQQCPGCAGRARVFVNEGSTSVSKLTLTDALITYKGAALTTTGTITISVSSGLSTSGPAGQYPFAVEASGTFLASTTAGSTVDGVDRILVKATVGPNLCQSTGIGLASFTTAALITPTCTIDNPIVDPLETDPDQASIVAPPFLAAGVAQFAPKEQQIIFCDNDGEGGTLCTPTLGMVATITLKGQHSAKFPGSLTSAHVPFQCDPGKGEFKGCEIISNYMASLGPKGFKVYDARLEPTRGSPSIDFRFLVASSADAWVTTRGRVDGDDDDDRGRDGGDNVSATRVRLETNGGGEVRAKGLCLAGSTDCSNDLPVRVYCGSEKTFETVIHLNSKGDGLAKLVFGVPCNDPGVLIMDEGDRFWVAAPAIR